MSDIDNRCLSVADLHFQRHLESSHAGFVFIHSSFTLPAHFVGKLMRCAR